MPLSVLVFFAVVLLDTATNTLWAPRHHALKHKGLGWEGYGWMHQFLHRAGGVVETVSTMLAGVLVAGAFGLVTLPMAMVAWVGTMWIKRGLVRLYRIWRKKIRFTAPHAVAQNGRRNTIMPRVEASWYLRTWFEFAHQDRRDAYQNPAPFWRQERFWLRFIPRLVAWVWLAAAAFGL